jgi:hypothetical protein
MRRALRAVVVTIVVLAGALVFTASAASASYDKACWHWGTFKDYSYVMEADWDGDGATDECFGIAPNRTIWHDWRTAGKWQPMPNDGHADDTCGWGRDRLTGYRKVGVWVDGYGYYYSLFSTASNRWLPWMREPETPTIHLCRPFPG